MPRRVGLDVCRPGRGPLPWAAARLHVPTVHAAAVRRDGTFTVPTDRLMNIHGYSPRPGGFFPLAATVRSLVAVPDLAYRDSPLAHVHRLVQPASASDALLDPGDPPLGVLEDLPSPYVPELWVLSTRDLRRPPDRQRRPDRSAHMGPVSDALGERELGALRSLLDSITRQGYQTDRARTIEGYFVVADDTRWRFVTTDGQHRLAVLVAMGVQEVRVRAWNGPAAVHRDHLGRWLRPRGPYRPETAERIVELLLERSGRERMTSRGGDMHTIAPHGVGTIDEEPVVGVGA